MMDNYLIHGANALTGALRYIEKPGAFRYDPRSVAVFLAAACKTLTVLKEDQGTLKGLTHLDHDQQIRLRSQSSSFFDAFLTADKELLVEAGMNQRMANYLFSDLSRFRAALDDKEFMSYDDAMARLSELQYSACKESGALDSSLTIVQRSVLVIGGGAIWVANAAADSVLSGLASALSQLGGSGLFTKGLRG
jgi:hypothetical protein